MAKKKTSKNKTIIIVVVITLTVLLLAIFATQKMSENKTSKISEAQSRQLAEKYFSEDNDGSELKKLYDLDGGWCYGMLPTDGSESTGGVMLCVDDTAQGYEITSFMNYPEDGDSMREYVASLESEYVNKPKSNGQKSWDIRVDL